jgi:hypothetical protein
MSDLKTSLLVNRQVPEFVREEHPLFISFLEAYYEYLETKQGTQINDLINQGKLLRNISDVDDSIEAFETNFLNTYANLIPRDVQVDKAFLIKNVLPLYLAKGSESSFKLLFRMLFNDEVEIVLPKNNVLRASDGQWTVDNILKIETVIRSVSYADGTSTRYRVAQEVTASDIEVYLNGVLQTVNTNYLIFTDDRWIIFNTPPAAGTLITFAYLNFDSVLLDPRYAGGGIKVTGLTSGATAIIEKSTKKIITDRLNLGFPFELYIDSRTVNGAFQNGEEIEAIVIDPDGVEAGYFVLRANTYSFVNKINIVYGGAGYANGDPVILVEGDPSDPATAVVESVVAGFIDKIVINYGGAGFINGNDIIVTGVPPLLDIAVDGVDTTGVANSTINTYSVYTDVISDYANVAISNSNYGFPSTVIPAGENVNTIIADALSPLELTDLGPITNVFITYSNVTTSYTPTLDAYGATYVAGATTFSITPLGSIGRIRINAAGTNYSVGDEVIFTSPAGSFGQGAAAAVKAVDLNGGITQIEIQPSRISGTANTTNNAAQVIGTGTSFTTELRVGDRIIINNQSRYINSISNNTYANVNVNFTMATTNKKIGKYGDYPLGGSNYTQGNFPTISVSSVAGTNANVQITSTMGNGEALAAYVGNSRPGEIISIRVLSGGSGYQYNPQVDLTQSGDGTAIANATINSSYESYPGRWTTSDSILSSSERKLQGRDYYVDYAYITSSVTEFKKYKNILKQLLHPVGMINYADLNQVVPFTANTLTLTSSQANTISGTVSITNNSIYVTGTNTRFNLANTKGTMTVGSNIAIDGNIRTISNIISNTNIAVSLAFTSSANAQTVIILT